MFIISVLAQGKMREVIRPNAGHTAVNTYLLAFSFFC